LWLFPAWEEIAGAFAARELGAEPFELNREHHHRLPYGPNFVVRTREQRQFPYDPNLGRSREGGALGEEIAVIEAILASGGKGWWVRDASVEHWIPKERQTVRHLRRFYGLLGRTWHRQNRYGPGRRWHDRYLLWGKALYAEVKYTCARLTGNPRRWVKPLVKASVLWGVIRN
jgi:hypothetical protein